MESLMSGVEPFILCAEFLNVCISKIAVMAALTVNLRCPRNLILSCLVAPFCVLARRPALHFITTRSRQEGGCTQGSLLVHDSVGGAPLWLVLC